MGRRSAERVVIVHSLAQARAAVGAAAALGVPVTLASAPGAPATVGPLWFEAVVAQATAEHAGAQVSAVLDCADAPGHVLAALRLGFKRVRFTGKSTVAEKLAAIARRRRARLLRGRLNALDLADVADPAAACRSWLAQP